MISVSGDSPAERESEKTGETQVLFKKSHRSILMKINKKSRGVRTRKKRKWRETKGDTSAALTSHFALHQINFGATHTQNKK